MMTMNLDNHSGIAIHAYEPGTVTLKAMVQNEDRSSTRLINCQSSLIITMQGVIENWPPQTIDELEQVHLDEVWNRKPELVLLGSGAQFCFPRTELAISFAQAGIGFEVMDTAAACRTYNILTAEGRDVMALLLLK